MQPVFTPAILTHAAAALAALAIGIAIFRRPKDSFTHQSFGNCSPGSHGRAVSRSSSSRRAAATRCA